MHPSATWLFFFAAASAGTPSGAYPLSTTAQRRAAAGLVACLPVSFNPVPHVGGMHMQALERANAGFGYYPGGPVLQVAGTPVFLDHHRLEFGNVDGVFAAPFDDAFGAGAWTDYADDTRITDPILADYGITGEDYGECMASPGTLQFSLNNAANNSGSLLGYYSPLHVGHRTGMDYDVPVRWALTYRGITYYKWRGRLSNATVVPGTQGERIVRCQAKDQIADWMVIPVPALPVQIGQLDSDLVHTVLNALDDQPPNRQIEYGLEHYDVAFDNAFDESVTVREVLIDILQSSQSRLAIIGDTVEGGLVRTWSRRYDAANRDVAYHFNNEIDLDTDALVVPGLRDNIIRQVHATVRATRTDTAADVFLYVQGTTSTLIGPRQVSDSIFGGYVDPQATATRVAGVEMQPPVADTDYQMNSQADGHGVDLTRYFLVTASYSATGVRWRIENTHPILSGYVTLLRCRGKGLYRRDVVIERVVSGRYGDRTLDLNLPYANSVNKGEDAANYAVQVLSRTVQRASSIRFLANKSHARMIAMLSLEPGRRIAITEPVVGLLQDEFVIRSVRLEMHERGLIWCTWGLSPADTSRGWLAGIPGASEAGVTTVAGY